ncbi:MAG: hypothetical protein COU42_02190 [Candidatus Nealsonbacteria bacterium CG10_big_fil_rev_8_21_14_0_10_36_24]|uniref:PrgI family protein n=2 Tax=Candidatus Nealsoniibacteriota TaxID=1817911 RepID=A0A2H0YPF9_9BACT|nr:MAG: hypothetical protein COU42_02190 [Candidatus Nealsonbacteria bacterium CG10_big_fil_rev_8_21_14_0_10_36_24]PIS40381.1 MAG: hypothetical protein COT32_00015 [Candidatus Nealsonbacteria bacterium CG08_land_8_20_14_0_20_36_22]
MEFTVPQFIEKEPKIVGPFTFKQFIFIGIAGGLSIFLFFTVPFLVFIILAIILVGGAFSLAFLKIERISLPVFIKNFLIFITKPKIYLWKKKTSPLKFLPAENGKEKKKLETKEKTEEGRKPKLKVIKGGRLHELFTHLETK